MPNGKGYTVTFDGVASTTFPNLICEQVSRRMTGKDRSVVREIAGREGAWRFGEKRGLRTITMEMAIVSDTFPVGRRTDLSAIADWVDKPGFKNLVISDEPDVYNVAFLANEPDIDEWRELGKFTLEFSAEPYTYASTISNEVMALTSEIPDDLVISDTIAAYPVIELTPAGGTLEGFTLVVNGESLIYGTPVGDGATITISSLAYVVMTGTGLDPTLSGTFDYDLITMANLSGLFPILVPGTNSVEIVAGVGSAATSVSLDISWRRRYR